MFFPKNNDWNAIFDEVKDKDYFINLLHFLDSEYKNKTIYPSRDELFNAFKLTPLNEIKVVIFGQDPYPNPNQAMGLAFSVKEGVALPPSLKNIFKEIYSEYEINKELPEDIERQIEDLTVKANIYSNEGETAKAEDLYNKIKELNKG